MQVVFINVFILFMLLFVGYIIGARKIVSHKAINDITNILIDVSIPCTIIVSMIRPFSARLINDTYKVILLVLIYQVGITFVAYFLSGLLKVDEKKRGSWIFAMVFSNNGFIGYPLMYALYGKDGLFIMAMGNMVQNVLIFSLGVKLITLNYSSNEKISFKNIVFTKQNFAVLIGMLIYIFQPKIPMPILTFMTYISNLTVPLSMMVVGLSLSRYEVKKMFTDKESYRLTFFRMIAVPTFFVILFKIFNIDANSSLPYAILFFTAALPSPAFTSIMAERYNTSVEFSSKCVFITTVISIISVPLFAGLL